jgi:hypothetical protein
MKQRADNYVALGFGKEYAWLDLANSRWNGYGKLTDHLRDPAWATHIVKHWNLACHFPAPVPLAQLIALRALLAHGRKIYRRCDRRARYECP